MIVMPISTKCQQAFVTAGFRGDQFEFVAQWIAVREFKRAHEGPDAVAAFDDVAAKAWAAWEAGTTTAGQDMVTASGPSAQAFLSAMQAATALGQLPGMEETDTTCKMNWQVFGCTANSFAVTGLLPIGGCTTAYPEYDCAMPMPGNLCKKSSWGIWAALGIGLAAFVGAYALVTSGGRSKRNPIPGHMWVISMDSTGAYIVTIGDPRSPSSTLKQRFHSLNDLKFWIRDNVGNTVSRSHIVDELGVVDRTVNGFDPFGPELEADKAIERRRWKR